MLGNKVDIPKNDDSSSEDDIPLAQRNNVKRVAQKPKVTENDSSSSDDDDVPLAQRKLTKKPSLKKDVKEEESSDDDDVPLAQKHAAKVKAEPMDVDKPSKKRPLDTPTEGKVKREKKVKKEEDDPTLYKWWEEQQPMVEDDSIKWTTLEHNGVLFPPEYVPHGIKMKYDGKPITLSPEAEEVASFFAALLETDHGKNPVFQKNFFADWQEVLKQNPKNPKITDFDKCDFGPIWEKFEKDKEKKKLLTKEEKLKIKEAKLKTEEPYLYATVDGRKEKVGNFRIEPPGLFRGRGSHPKTGKLKKRVLPEQVTLNLGADAKIPDPPAGHKWASVVHDQTATWLATWKENVNGSIKYVFLAATSTWKGQSDMQKFEKARELKNYVKKIRADYTRELKDKLSETRQRATAMYLIDRLALRAGNEKGEDEADTVGCCSLRYEHITLEPPNKLHFDFLGKDSIRYQNTVEVDPQVYKNIGIFKKQVGPGNPIFDRLTTTGLNKYLNSCMKGLSAKVFRTFNASITFQQQVDKMTNPNDSLADKLLSYNRANREVAILCNHQRSASKTHDQMIGKIEDRVRALKYQRMKLRKQLFALDATMKKQSEYADMESDLDDEWILEHEDHLVEKEREKITNRFNRNNEKLAAEKQPLVPESELKEKLKAADELEIRLKKERKLEKIEPKPSMTVDKLIANIRKVDDRIYATKNQITDKEENKEIALGTSKLNYIDPRITVAWCRQHEVPQEKVFSKTLLDKFRWAQNIPNDWKF
jgi:DNA topoisomerase-1